MSLRTIGIVFRKEIRDIVRDKKTIISSFAIPLVVFPVMFALLGGNISKMMSSMDDTRIAFSANVEEPMKEAIRNDILAGQGVFEFIDGEDATTLMKEEKVDVIIDAPQNAYEQYRAERTVPVRIVSDSSKTRSLSGAQNVASAFAAYNERIVDEKLAAQGIRLADLSPFATTDEPLSAYAAENGEQAVAGGGNMMLNMLLPMLVTLMVAIGGLAAATDLVAGEKERQTLEPLLSTRADRMSILAGKYITVVLFSLCSLVSSLLGILISMNIGGGAALFTMGGQASASFSLPIRSTVLALVSTLLTGMLFAAFEITISAMARSYKEAQTYLSFITIVAMVPAYWTMMMQAGDFTIPMMCIPVVGATASLKMVLAGYTPIGHMIAALLSSVAYLAIALGISGTMLNRESVLFRS